MTTHVGAALGAAHRVGVVHRDVRPANIFLDEDGHFFLGDFGIAYEVAAPPDALESLSVGSPAHASPEQLRREPVGPPADVYALAVTVYECLAGHLPFHDSRTKSELLQRQLHDPIPRLALVRADVDARLDEVLAMATAKDPARRYASAADFVDDLVAAASGVSGRPTRRPATAEDHADLRNPYKGLLAFQEADSADFYGRDRLVERLIDRLGLPDPNGRLITVVGPSGAGKSSLVSAGLLPALRAGALPGSANWFMTSMVPGSHPFEELETALSRIATRPTHGLAGLMASDRRGIARAMKQTGLDDGGEVVLVIDQMEELFTLCSDESVRQRFLSGLEVAMIEPRSRLRVVLTLRADFFDRPLRHPGFASLIGASTVAVTPLAPDELELAITEPAARLGVSFEPGLVARIVADVVGQPGSLPLLQYSLTELFDRRRAGVLTIEAYEDIGELTGALARRGEQLYDEASPAERPAVRRVFTRLVTLGQGTEDTRRRVARRELGTTPEVHAVIQRYGAARLLSFDRDPLSREQTVEVSHEALLRDWPRLRHWLDEDRDGLRLHRHLTVTATTWEAAERDPSELYRGGRLEAASHWAGDHPQELNESEAAFLASSQDALERENASRQRSARRLRRALVGVACIAVVALGAGGVAWHQQRNATTSRLRADRSAAAAAEQRDAARKASADADRERQVAVALALDAEIGRMAADAPSLAENDLSLGLLLAAEANQRSNDPRTLRALREVLVGAGPILGVIRTDERQWAVGVTPDGHLVAFAETAITVWDESTRRFLKQIPVSVPPAEVAGRIWDRAVMAGGTVAWVGSDRDVWLADVVSGTVTHRGLADVSGLALDPTGRRLAIADRLGAVSVYDIGASNQPSWTVPGDGIASIGELATSTGLPLLGQDITGIDVTNEPIATDLSFSRSGDRVYVARGAGVRMIDAASGSVTGTVARSSLTSLYGQLVEPLAGDPDRVVISDVFSFAIGDLRTGKVTELPAPSPIGIGDVFGGVVPLRGDRFLAQKLSGAIWVMNAEGGVEFGPVDPHIGQLFGVTAFDDATRAAVAGENGVAIVALDGSGLIRSTIPRPVELEALSIAHDASVIAINDDVFADIDSPPGAPSVLLRCAPGQPPASCVAMDSISLTPDNAVFSVGRGLLYTLFRFGRERIGRLYDDQTGEAVSEPLDGVTAGAVVPSTRAWIATPSLEDPAVEIRSLPEGTLIARIPTDGVAGVAGSANPDRLLVFNLYLGGSMVVRTDTWQVVPSPLGPGEVVNAVFSNDGTLLVTVSSTGEVVLRDGTTFAQLRTLTGDGGTGDVDASFAFSSDNRFLLAVIGGRAQLWDVASGDPIGGPLDPGEVVGYPQAVAGEHLRFVAPTPQTIDIWDLDTERWNDIACRAAGRNLTIVEWDLYGPTGIPYHHTCPQWSSGAAKP